MKSKENLRVARNKHKHNKTSEQFRLPDSDTISEWFSRDHPDRLKRIFSLDLENYNKYSVYQVYKDKGLF